MGRNFAKACSSRRPSALVVAGAYGPPAPSNAARVRASRSSRYAGGSPPSPASFGETEPMTTNIVSLADARAARQAASAGPQPDPETAATLDPWPLSKRGNPWFRARDHLFVALSPKWRGSSWRLWVKEPGAEKGRTLGADFSSFGALQRGVVAFLAEVAGIAGGEVE
jgi:hypothetical protein